MIFSDTSAICSKQRPVLLIICKTKLCT